MTHEQDKRTVAGQSGRYPRRATTFEWIEFFCEIMRSILGILRTFSN